MEGKAWVSPQPFIQRSAVSAAEKASAIYFQETGPKKTVYKDKKRHYFASCFSMNQLTLKNKVTGLTMKIHDLVPPRQSTGLQCATPNL